MDGLKSEQVHKIDYIYKILYDVLIYVTYVYYCAYIIQQTTCEESIAYFFYVDSEY